MIEKDEIIELVKSVIVMLFALYLFFAFLIPSAEKTRQFFFERRKKGTDEKEQAVAT